MASDEFAESLGEHLRSKPKLKLIERRILKVIDSKPSKRRTRFLERLESHTRVHMGFSATARIDWSKIDWSKVLDFILKLAAILLPLLLAL